MTHQHPAICMKELCFAYDGAMVLQDIELCIERGSFTSIVGPNGGGKSTLMKLILGLLKPTQGSVSIFGEEPRAMCASIGYLPQHLQFDPQFPISTMDVVLMGRLKPFRFSGCFHEADRKAARDALDQVGLGHARHTPFASLSGGQQQRALIARALVCEPDLLLLDEPTANLDRPSEGMLYELLKSLKGKLTIIIVSHDIGFVSSFVDRVACVNRTLQIHPTSHFSGELIDELYGSTMKMVRHDIHHQEQHHE